MYPHKFKVPQLQKINTKVMSKKIILCLFIATSIFAACNNSSTDKKENKMETLQTAAKPANTSTTINQTVSIKEILDNYLKMKNAFTTDNSANAATAGEEMVKSFTGFDKTALTTAQVKTYNDIEDDAKEHAEHIGLNAGKIKHQREHFDLLSKDIYALVKTFGAGQKLYYDHCPMYNTGKGANWLSETKEIANPYLGKSMPTCGSVKEEIK